MGSRDKRGSAQAHHKLKMDAIKKKMQAMKVEKDNACDRSDQCEEASKAAKIRAEKAEDEVAELNAKARQLETELDLCTEKLGIVTLQLEEKEKSLLAAEAEMNALNRRVSGLEEDLRRLKRSCCRPPPSWTRLALPLTTLSVLRRCLRTRLEMTTRGSPSWRRNSRRPGTRPRLLTPPMMRWPRSWPPVSLTSRRLRREPTLASRRSWSLRRS